jgi:hypothetical protein
VRLVVSQTSREQTHVLRAGAGIAGPNGQGLSFLQMTVAQRHKLEMKESARLEDETVATGKTGARDQKVGEGNFELC